METLNCDPIVYFCYPILVSVSQLRNAASARREREYKKIERKFARARCAAYVLPGVAFMPCLERLAIAIQFILV